MKDNLQRTTMGDVPIPGEMKKAAQVAWLMQVNTNYQE
jgi:hypothetical protein